MGHPRDGDVLPSAPLQRLRRPAPPRRDEAGSHPDDPYRRSILGVFSIPHHKPTGKLLMTLPHPTDSSETTLTQALFNAIRYYLGGRRGLIIIATVTVIAGLALNWSDRKSTRLTSSH